MGAELLSCPGPDALGRLAEQRPDPAERAALVAHLAGCPLCRAIVTGLARAQGFAAPVPAPGGALPDVSAVSAPRSLWWVPWVTHAVLAVAVGLAAWWFLGRTRP